MFNNLFRSKPKPHVISLTWTSNSESDNLYLARLDTGEVIYIVYTCINGLWGFDLTKYLSKLEALRAAEEKALAEGYEIMMRVRK